MEIRVFADMAARNLSVPLAPVVGSCARPLPSHMLTAAMQRTPWFRTSYFRPFLGLASFLGDSLASFLGWISAFNTSSNVALIFSGFSSLRGIGRRYGNVVEPSSGVRDRSALQFGLVHHT